MVALRNLYDATRKFLSESFIIFGLQIKKFIYGLNQASRQWYLKFDHVISDFGFKEIVDDQYIYHKSKEYISCAICE